MTLSTATVAVIAQYDQNVEGSRAITLSNDTPRSGTSSSVEYAFDTEGNYYNVFAVKPASGCDFDMRLYNDSSYLTQVEFSNAGGSAIDLVVLDRNGDYGTRTYYPKVPQWSGTSYYIEAQYNTTSLAINTSVVDSFRTGEIFDSWDCYLSSGKTYEILLESVPSGAYYNIYVFSGTSFLVHYPSTYGYIASGNQVSSIRFVPPATKYYCIVVTNENNVTGSYTLKVKHVPAISQDSPATGTLSSANKWDFWQTTAPASKFTAYAIKPPTGGDFDLEVYDSFNRSTLVASSSYTGDRPDVVVLNRMSQGSSADYYVKVKQYSSYYGTYSLEYQASTSVTAGSQVTGTMVSGEVLDIWHVQLTGGILYDVTFTTMPAGASYDVYIFNTTGGASAYSYLAWGNQSTPLSYQPTSTGTFCVVLINVNGFTGSYAWIVAQNPGTIIYPLTLGTTRAEDTITSSITEFKYSFTASKGAYTAVAQKPPAGIDFDLRLYSDSSFSTYLGGSFLGAGLTDIYVYDGTDLSADTTRYAKVSRVSTSDTGLITIEADNTAVLSVGTQRQKSITTSNLIDMYTVSLTSGREYIIEFPQLPSGTLTFYLFRGSGSISAALLSGTSDTAVNYTPTATDYYGILVVSNGASGTYKIVVREVVKLTVGNTVAGSLSSSRPFDEYRFTVYAGRMTAVVAKPISADFNSNLRVYSDIWMTQEVSYSTVAGAGIDAVVIDGSSLAQDTDYFVKVYISSGTGDYRITYTSKTIQAVGSTVSRTMEADKIGELGNVNLVSGKQYSVSLVSVPSGALYNIYVFNTTSRLTQAIATGSQSAPATFTAQASGIYSFLVTNENAIGGTYSIKVSEVAVPEFTMAVSPANATFSAGSNTSFVITLTSKNGFASTVVLTVLSSLPTGMTAVFSPVSVVPTANSILYVNTTAATPVGTYQIQFQASGGSITITSVVNVTVTTPPFGRDLIVQSISVSPFSPVENLNANFTAVIKNVGDTDITSLFTVAVYLDSSITPAKTFTVSFLAANQTITLTWDALKFTTPGKHSIRTVADSGATVNEANETNNEKAMQVFAAKRAYS
ncbi:MAG: CARDB domain-containing protein, partial [Thermoplasmata archaeon]